MSSHVAIACLLAISVMGMTAACDRQSPPAEQANVSGAAPDEAAPVPDPAPDEAAPAAATASLAGKVDRSHKGEAAPSASFADPAGKPTTLAAFRGKPVLVNLWATWCAPCVAEMPTLDTLAGTGAVRVVAVAQDLQPDKVVPFFAAKRFVHLQPYQDPTLGLSTELGANLPTTILYDAAGREVWRVTGGFDWASAEAKALVAQG